VICLIEKAKGAAILTELDETQKLFAIDWVRIDRQLSLRKCCRDRDGCTTQQNHLLRTIQFSRARTATPGLAFTRVAPVNDRYVLMENLEQAPQNETM
jgi:hypothetical protein